MSLIYKIRILGQAGLAILVVCLILGHANGQEKLPDCDSCKCPETRIKTDSRDAREGETIVFEVVIVDSRLKNCPMTYDWLVSDGEIVGGQGTNRLRLKVPEKSAGTTISVAATINGENGCEGNPSETIAIVPKKP